MKRKVIITVFTVLIILAFVIAPIVISTYTQKNTEPRVIEDNNGNITIIGPGEGMSDEEYKNLELQEKAETANKLESSIQTMSMNSNNTVEVMSEEKKEEMEAEMAANRQKEEKLVNILYQYNTKEIVDKVLDDVKKVEENNLINSSNLPDEYLREYELIINTYEKNELSDEEKGIVKEYLENILNSVDSTGNSDLKNRIENIIK